jgi:drug/metabolite transporter (DMT)-like permease
VLWRVIGHGHRASREAVAALFCGLGLAVLLLHSFVDFNLRIPALAILACLLAGAFLRPLPSHAVRP